MIGAIICVVLMVAGLVYAGLAANKNLDKNFKQNKNKEKSTI